MKVSIAMATFNGAEYLLAQLQSFLDQERGPDELVICDDVSTDDTIRIIDGFAAKAPFRVHVYRNDFMLGFTANFSKAMSLCDGDLVFVCDQDDIWDPEKIQTVIAELEANPSAWLLVHDGKLVDSNLAWTGTTMLGQVMAGYGDSRSLVTGALTCYRKQLSRFILPIPPGLVGHDQWMHLIASLCGKRMVTTTSLQIIRRHGANTSGWVASSTEKISRLTVFLNALRTPVAARYDDRLLINWYASQVIREAIRLCAGDLSQETLAVSLNFLEAERVAIKARQRIVELGRFRRSIAAMRLLFSGAYRHFNGVSSFLRDLAR